jgi:uncharacterized protein related to proFAR isomerase
MKKVILAVVTTLIATSGINAANIKLVAQNDTAETQLCMTAATETISATREKAEELGINYVMFKNNTLCNGQKVSSFAKRINKLQTQEEAVVVARNIKMVNKNNTAETNVCIEAAKYSFKEASIGYEGQASEITCNGISIKKFARKYNKEAVFS